jgi:hypothetical protein
MNYGLWYPKNKNFQLLAYTDADWANCMDERKSTSGGAFFLRDSLVAWLSKKQGSISLSTTEAEYMLACLQAGVLVIDGKIRVCSDGKIGTT